MPYNGKTNSEYQYEYAKSKYDRIVLQVPKGQREEIRKIASSVGESVNSFIYKATVERIGRIVASEKRSDEE